MRSLLLLCLAFSPAAHAGALDPNFQVSVDPSVYSAAAFQRKGFAAQELPAINRDPASTPTRAEREAAFDRVQGLQAEISKLDELDRDILYVRARARSFDALRDKYPHVSADALRRLQALLK